MKFTVKNKMKRNDESKAMNGFLNTLLRKAVIVAAAQQSLEDAPECLESMLDQISEQELATEEIIEMAFIHGYKHGADDMIEVLTQDDQ
ncbi:hypothetical protein [Lactococcus taiwanensis]|uniref:hypothetical protein n=1 Tax=Lactococcus taiwanensis TaxID=1151742 RepID=UPI003513C18D